MNDKIKIIVTVVAVIIAGAGAVAYGAATAPKPTPAKPTATVVSRSQADLDALLKAEQPTITSVLTATYPKITTDYTINPGRLYDQGQWYGTTLTYTGSDSMNRDTLRVLLQKKNGIWTIRTHPPEPLLSTIEFPDVPKSVLQSINKAISLPGSDSSPTITVNG